LLSAKDSVNTYVIPTRNNVPVYKNQNWKTADTPLFHVSQSDRLKVMKQKENVLKILNSNNRTGWLEKQYVTLAKYLNVMTFEGANVDGYIETPSLIIIQGSNPKDDTPLILSRSFKENLLVNVDNETARRLHE